MPRKKPSRNTTSGRTRKSSTARNSSGSSSDSKLSARTRKAINTLPSHAKDIYKKAHQSALRQYKSPSARRGGRRQGREEVAHKVAWSAVKRQYAKEGDRWVRREEEQQ